MSDITLGPVDKWSFSRLHAFEECPYRVYLSSVKKEKGPAYDDDPDHPLTRGNREHKNCEDFVGGKTDKTTKAMNKFKPELEMLKEDFDDGKLELEGDWAFDVDWQPTGWWDDNAWARIKLDVWKLVDPTTGKVIDYKTGKKFGNEVKHTQQAQLYMVGAFLKYPEVDLIETEFLYLDHGLRMNKSYKRDKLPLYLKKFTDRALKMTTCTDFKPKPTKMNCRWCDYGPENGTGACPYGVPLNG